MSFVLVTPATRGLSLAITRHFLQHSPLPVYATHRAGEPDDVKAAILKGTNNVDPARLTLLPLDLTSEPSIAAAADELAAALPRDAHLHTAFLTGGILHPEKQPAALDLADVTATFQINVIAHLLLIKHFSRFLPPAHPARDGAPAKWVHVSARVGSIADNARGGWYSYRASKAALNQVVRTFDRQLEMGKSQAMCVGVHPGTVKTELSREFWGGVAKDKLFEPEVAAANLVNVVEALQTEQRGKIWDYAGKQVAW